MSVMGSKTKVLFFLVSLGGGGAERTCVNIINNLDRSKFEPVLVLGTADDARYIDLLCDDVKVIVLGAPRLRYVFMKLLRCIRKEQPDLLFTTMTHNNVMLLVVKMFLPEKIPIVVREANHWLGSNQIPTLAKWVVKFAYNHLADSIIALSKGVKRDLVEKFGIRDSKITVIYNPVEVKTIQQLACEPLQLDDHSQGKTVLAVGRLVESKDYVTLLRAFALVTQHVRARLVVLGEGPLEQQLKQLCSKLGIEDRVWFLGFKHNPYKYMRNADLFVLTSQSEGFGHVIVEAMAVGTPVIATDCKSGPGEIIEDDKYGLLVPVGDHRALAERIISVLENEDLRNGLKLAGSKRALDFDAIRITKLYEELFLDAVNGCV
jgi:glycosyltransferase involved in cell wall biosynthesis